MRVLVTRQVDREAVALLESRFAVDYRNENRPLPRTFLAAHLGEYDAVLCTVSEVLDAELLRLSQPRLRVVSNLAAGLDNIAADVARQLGIRVCNIPDTTVESTADLTLALALALIRQVVPARQFVLDGQWREWDPQIFLGRTISGLTWGICGYGRIGQAVARRAHAFGASIIYQDPQVERATTHGAPGVRRVELAELLAVSDVLSIHVPLTESTTGLIGRAELAAMKPSAFVVNMARGRVVDSEALTEALRRGELAGAALDVFDPEPLDGRHEILGLSNVLVTPHIGTGTVECRRAMAIEAARNIIDHFREEGR